MKNLRSVRYSILLVSAVTVSAPALADLEVTTSVQIRATAEFETPLAAHGNWVEFGSHGRCWRPGHIAVGWRPYCSGEWVWTDCGWYWASDEPWGWACYHYGSWVNDPVLGWVWVPGVEWAPAWVSWRVGGGYIGWAPLPPQGVVFASHPKAELFVFVGETKFASPIKPGVLVVNSTPFIKSTILVGGIERTSRNLGGGGAQKVCINSGPSIERLQKATGKSFAPASIREVVSKNPAPSKSAQTMAANQSAARGNHKDPSEHPGSDHGDNSGRSNGASSDRGYDPGNNPNSSGAKGAGGNSAGRGGHGKH